MDLRDLRKKPLHKPPQESTSYQCKISVPIKSPKQKKAKRQGTNIICSTPLNAVKKNIFEDDNQQMSPIRNPSSLTSENSSPGKLVDQEELENKLQVNKISKNEPEKLVTSREEMQDCLYPFPLISKMQVYNMVLCDSEPDIPIRNKRRGRKQVYTCSLSDDKNKNDSNTCVKKNNNKNLIDNSTAVQNIFEKVVDANDKNKKVNSRTNNSSSVNSPKSKRLKTEKKDIEVISKIENNSFVPLRAKSEKIKKDIQNGKTKCSVNLRSIEIKNKIDKKDDDTIFNETTDLIVAKTSLKNNSMTRKCSEYILNNTVVADNNKGNLQVFQVSNGIHSAIVIHNSNTKTRNSKISENVSNGKSTTEENKINSENKNNIIESNNIAHNTKKNQFSQPERKLRPSKNQKSKISENVSNDKSTIVAHSLNIENNKISSENKNKITNLTNTAHESDNLNEIEFAQPKSKAQPSKTKKTKIDENIHELRKSSRKRMPSCKYWLNSQSDEQAEKNIEKANSRNKKSVKSTQELNPIDILVKDKKSKKISDKSNVESLSKMDEKSPSILDKAEKEDFPVKVQNFMTTLEKRQSNKQLNIEIKQTPKDKKQSRQSVKGNKNVSIKLLKSVLTARKIRKSQRLSKFPTPKKTPKKQTKLEFSDGDDSYTTEEENGIPRDTLMLNIGIEGIKEFPSSGKAEKRKIESNIEIYQPKKAKLKPENEYSFKRMALLADEIPSSAGALADVQVDGKRCLLECFGKFPRQCNRNQRNSDVSVGVSVNNGHITSGVLEIEPAGRKKYEYAKKVDLFFLVLEGIAEVAIGNSSRVLRLGHNFYVPKDTSYYILNLSNTDKLVIYFVKIFK